MVLAYYVHRLYVATMVLLCDHNDHSVAMVTYTVVVVDV